jgi:hypothetical protein
LFLGEMTMASKTDDFPEYLERITDALLEETACHYIWLAEIGPKEARANYEPRRDMIVAECKRRRRPDIFERARQRVR